MQPVKIFISSPIFGFEEVRKRAIDAILNFGHYPEAQEQWSASTVPPLEDCLKRVTDSSALVLLIGPKYGNVDPQTQKSITELEYEKAEELGIPRFVFVIIPPGKDKWEPEDEKPEEREKHRKFYARVKQNVVYKKIPQDKLEQEIVYALRNYGPLGPRTKLFQKYEEYFKDLLNPNALFSLTQPFIGQLPPELNDFVSGADSKIGVIYGRGGVGKTKLIYEFAKTFKDNFREWEIRFAWPESQFENSSLLELPEGKCVIVLDDADRFDNIERLLGLLRDSRFSDRVKFLLAARQSGKALLTSALLHFQGQWKELIELKAPSLPDITELAKFSLGDRGTDMDLVQRLARVSSDCPLVTVVGGKLISEGKIAHDDPLLMGDHADFHRMVFARLLSEYTTKLPGYTGNPERWDLLIRVICAVGPVYPADEMFGKKLSEILGMEPYQIRWNVKQLEESGILYRAGRRVRLVPDVLADHVLESACIQDRSPTGFVEKIFHLFADSEIYLSNLLENLAQIEYRKELGGQPVPLLDEIWAELRTLFKNSSRAERAEFLKSLHRFALFQPRKTLDLCRWAIENPTDKAYGDNIPEEWKKLLSEPTYDHVIKEIPELLRSVSHSYEYLEEACKLLWQLGRDDERERNPHPKHPIRILIDIGKYSRYKPKEYNEKYLKIIADWLERPIEVYGHKYSIVHLFEPLLARGIEETRSEGFQFVLSWFPLRCSKEVQAIREKTFSCLLRILREGQPRDQLRVLEVFGAILANPEGRFGKSLPPEQLPEWVPEQLQVLKSLENILDAHPNPFITLTILERLDWPSQHAWHPHVKQEALRLLKRTNQEDLDFRIISSFSGGKFTKYIGESFEAARKRRSEEASLAASELLERFSCKEISDKINADLKGIQDFGRQLGEGLIIKHLCEKKPELAKFLAEDIYENPNSPLSSYIHVILAFLQSHDAPWANSFIKKCTLSSDAMLRWRVAYGYGNGGWLDTINAVSEEDWKNLEKLAQDEDRGVKMNVLQALPKLARIQDPSVAKRAIELAISVEVDSDPRLASELADVFAPGHGFPITMLSDDQIEEILKKLVPVKNIEYWIMDLLSRFYAKDPRKVISFFFDRTQLHPKDQEQSLQYHPVPFDTMGAVFASPLTNADYWKWYLEEFFKRIKKCKDDLGRQYWISHLFALFANYQAVEQPMLTLINNAKSKEDVQAIIALLQNMKSSFVLGQPEVVRQFMLLCWKIGQETYERAASTLVSSAMSGVISGTPGQPPPALVDKLEKAKHLAQRFNNEEPVRRLYEDVALSIKSEIDRMAERDEEILDDQS